MKMLMILTFLVLILASCSINQKVQPLSMGVMSFNVDSENYEIVGEIEGEAKLTRVLIFPFGINGDGGMATPGFGFNVYDAVKSQAMFNALNSFEDVDYIIAPKYEVEIKEYLVFGTVYVKVTGKGVVLK